MKKLQRVLSVLLCLCLTAGLLPAMPAMAAGEIFYVSSTGDDANPGSSAAPFATIQTAYNAISDSGTIRILGNLDVDNNILCGQNKDVTILGDGGNVVTYVGSLNLNSNTEGLFTVTAGSVTFENMTACLPESRGTNARLLYIGSYGHVTLGNGAVMQNGYLAYSGGGALVDGGTLVMLPGSAVQGCYVGNNTSATGGGVYVRAGTFHMQGGSIDGNTIHASGSYPGNGAGVAIGAGAEFRMSGGVISGNIADAAGGGVYVEQGGSFYLNGAASITSNTILGGSENNVYLHQGATIGVTGALTGVVGVTAAVPDYDIPIAATDGYALNESDEDALYYDGGAYDIRLRDGNLVLYHFVSEVTRALENLTSTNMANETPLGRDYATTLTPQEGYILPAEIAAFVAGARLGAEGFSYDSTTGEVVIFAEYVTGDLAIEAYGNKQHAVTVSVTNAQTDLAENEFIVYNETTTVICISAAPRYARPSSVAVTGSCNYTYADGVLTITDAASDIGVSIAGDEIPHTIHFDPVVGTVNPVQKEINESQLLLGELPTPTRTGYTFTGWYTQSGTKVTAATENHMTEDLYLAARWSADTNIRYVVQHYTEYVDSGSNPGYAGQGLHFMSYGGKTRQYYLHDEQTYNDGTADGSRTIADMLTGDFSPLNAEGFTPNGSNVYQVIMLPDGSSVFPFYYDRNTLRASFDPNGGTLAGGASMDVTYGSVYGMLPSATKTGYTLLGWFTSPTGGTQVQAGDICSIAANHTLYAHWQADGATTYKVVHMVQKLSDNVVGYEKNSSNYSVLQTDTLCGTSGMTVYVYAMSITGFSPSGENVYETGILADGTTVHTLYYDRAITDVSYHPNGGTEVVSGGRLYYGGTFVTFPTSPTRVGYTFAGWHTGIGEESRQVTVGTSISDINPLATPTLTLYAHWTARSYDLMFQAHGGTGADPKMVTYDKPIGVLPEPVKGGYLFQGWYLDDTLLGAPSGAPITEDTVVSVDTVLATAGDGAESIKTLNAWYLPLEVAITFDVAGGDAIADNTRTAVYDTRFEKMAGGIPVATRTGYTFTGWFFEAGARLEGAAYSKLLESVTVHARWVANVYKVTLEGMGGEVPSPGYIAVTYDDIYTLPIPTRVGYGFEGWYTAQVGGSEVVTGDAVTISAQQVLYARWMPLTFTVTFDPQGGELDHGDAITVVYDSKYGTLPTVRRNGYTFAGWFTAPEKGGERVAADTAVQVLEDSTLYARWTTMSYGGGTGGGVVAPLPPVVQYCITATAGPGAVISPVGEVLVDEGEDFLFSVMPAQGHLIVDVMVDGVSLGAMDSYKFCVVEAEHTIRAVAIPYFTDQHIAYVTGRSDGRIHPEAEVSRAELAAMLFRLLSGDAIERFGTTENNFPDVPDDTWYSEAVSTLAGMGILAGYGDGTFGSGDTLTRAQLAVVLSRFDNREANGEEYFKDLDGHWAEKEINKAAKNGWVRGHSDGTFRPDSPVTRAEVIAVINRMLGRIPAGHHALLPEMAVWQDNADPTAWYYLDIQESTNSHIYHFAEDGETWEALLP